MRAIIRVGFAAFSYLLTEAVAFHLPRFLMPSNGSNFRYAVSDGPP